MSTANESFVGVSYIPVSLSSLDLAPHELDCLGTGVVASQPDVLRASLRVPPPRTFVNASTLPSVSYRTASLLNVGLNVF